VLAGGAADQGQGALGVPRAREHEEIRLRVAQRRPALFDAAQDSYDLDRGVGRQGRAHRRLLDSFVERDERSDRVVYHV
jgi:hypothetical protein